MNNFPSHTECLVSGSKKLKRLKGYEQQYLVKSYPLGFVFCSRIPSAEELTTHYNGYKRDEYLSPVTVTRFNQLLDEFEKFRKAGRILDIGCSIGLFLTEAKKRGWEVHGTEFTDKAVELCTAKGIQMQQGKLDPSWYTDGYFDIVVSLEVIEHINNPVEEVRNIQKILRQGGLFYFTTPNFNALERYILKAKYNIIEYPEHLSYYTKKTINYLLEKNGFRKKKLTTTGISLTRIRTSLRYSKESLISATSTDEKIRTSIEKNSVIRFAKNIINAILNMLGIGNSLKGWYIKR